MVTNDAYEECKTVQAIGKRNGHNKSHGAHNHRQNDVRFDNDNILLKEFESFYKLILKIIV